MELYDGRDIMKSHSYALQSVLLMRNSLIMSTTFLSKLSPNCTIVKKLDFNQLFNVLINCSFKRGNLFSYFL